jgi:hypothetical protein
MTVTFAPPRTIPCQLLDLIAKRAQRVGWFTKAKLEVYDLVWLDGERYCGTFGEGPNGIYQYFFFEDGVMMTSYVAYGCRAAALRAVLVGLGDSI